MIGRVACLCVLALSVGACVTEGPRQDGGTRVRPVWNDIAVDAIVLLRTPLVDTNADAIEDTLPLSVLLFSRDRAHATPLWVKGRFEFRLDGPDGLEIKRWRFDVDASAAARRSMGEVGKGYRFNLTELDMVHEEVGSRPTRLFARFEPIEGEAVVTREPLTLRVGRTASGGGSG